jgi:hypothetical protein
MQESDKNALSVENLIGRKNLKEIVVWDNNITMNLKRKWVDNTHWTDLAQDRNQWRAL